MQDGRILLTSEWIALDGSASRARFSRAAFDAAEHANSNGVLGPPTDNAPGCQTPNVPPGTRWFFGPAFTNPLTSADIITSPEDAGHGCAGLTISWYVNVGANEPDVDGDGFPDTDFFVAVQQFEDMDVVGCSDDGTNFIDGVIYDFSGNQWDPAFYNYANIEINQLSHTMPADGAGGYQMFLAIAFDGTTFRLPTLGVDPETQTGVAAQPMLWGTGEHEPIDDGRAGTEVDGQFDDDNPSDGVHDFATECNSYLYGVCPDPLAPSVGFWFKTAPCPCDLSHDGVIDIADLVLLLANFGRTETWSISGDINGDLVVSIADLALLLACFGMSC